MRTHMPLFFLTIVPCSREAPVLTELESSSRELQQVVNGYNYICLLWFKLCTKVKEEENFLVIVVSAALKCKPQNNFGPQNL